MSFPIPVFPLSMDQWIFPRIPNNGAPDVTGIQAQLYHNPHAVFPWWMPPGGPTDPNYHYDYLGLVKVPLGAMTPTKGDILLPNNTGVWYYKVVAFYHFYAGFPQEFIGIYGYRVDAAATPVFRT